MPKNANSNWSLLLWQAFIRAGWFIVYSFPAPHSPVVNSVQFNDVAFPLSAALPGNIYRSFLLYSAIYFLKEKEFIRFVRHVWSWPVNSKKLLQRFKGNCTDLVNMHLPSMGSEDKITCHTLIFFPKLIAHLLVRKSTKYRNRNRINQTISLPLFKCHPHTSHLLNKPVLFHSPPQCSHILLWFTTSAGTGAPYSPLPVSILISGTWEATFSLLNICAQPQPRSQARRAGMLQKSNPVHNKRLPTAAQHLSATISRQKWIYINAFCAIVSGKTLLD